MIWHYRRYSLLLWS